MPKIRLEQKKAKSDQGLSKWRARGLTLLVARTEHANTQNPAYSAG
jgi:hypothetical protein